ncbi:hypothetical protein, partial [Thiolapillus sp.]
MRNSVKHLFLRLFAGAIIASTAAPAAQITDMVTYNASPLVIRIHEGKHSKWLQVRKLTRVRTGQLIKLDELPQKGSVEIHGVRIRYTPAKGAQGRDYFSLLICDSLQSCVQRDVVAIIDTHDEPPKSAFLEYYLKENEGSRWEMPFLDDEMPTPTRVELLRAPEHLSVENNGRAFRVINHPGWSGITGFDYRVCDYLEHCIDSTAHVTILPNAVLPGAVIARSDNHAKLADGHYPLTTEPLTDLQTGRPITSPRGISVYAHFESLKNHTLNVNGMTLRPGAEIILPNYDIEKEGGRVSIPAKWEHPDKVPNGYIGEITVRLANFDVPNQVFPVFAGEIARKVSMEEVPREFPVAVFRHVYLGMATQLFANDSYDGQLAWTAYLLKAPSIKQTGEGHMFSFSGDSLGDWVVDLKATTPKEKLLWRRVIHVLPPPLPEPNIVKTLVQNSVVLHGLPSAGAHPGLKSEWVLPNSDTADTNPLKHTFGQSEYGLYTYRIWYESDADRYKESSIMIHDRNTEWPQWTITKKVLAKHWPIEVDYRVMPSLLDYVKNNMEHLSFKYMIPRDASISFRHLNRATVHFGEGGSYPVVVRISDDQGHSTELKDEVVLDELPTLSGALDIFSEDPWYRVPLDVNVTPVIEQSFDGEKVSELRYYLDGKLLHAGSETYYIIRDIETPATYRVRVDIKTNYDRRLSLKDTFTATSTEPPQCNVELKLDAVLHIWIVETDCEENEGPITELRWQLSLTDTPDDYITFFTHKRQASVPHWASRRGIKHIRLEAHNDKNHISRTVIDFAEVKATVLEEINTSG